MIYKIHLNFHFLGNIYGLQLLICWKKKKEKIKFIKGRV